MNQIKTHGLQRVNGLVEFRAGKPSVLSSHFISCSTGGARHGWRRLMTFGSGAATWSRGSRSLGFTFALSSANFCADPKIIKST